MQFSFNEKICSDICKEKGSIPEKNSQNYFETSSFLLRKQLLPESFSSLPSFSVRDLPPSCLLGNTELEDSPLEREKYLFFEDQSSFQFIPFHNGYSEIYNCMEQEQDQPVTCEGKNCPKNGVKGVANDVKSQAKGSNWHDSCGQELKSHSINTQVGSLSREKKTSGNGFMAKNVTKNLGKLLMKFTWKNRSHLEEKMPCSKEEWISFMEKLKEWKGESNVTRQFLTSKWLGLNIQNRLFRVVSHHFFRKHCLPAVMRSNIHHKKIHFERISKFVQAIVDPKGLEYLS